ncbi:MAG: phosphatase PAP2 family protein [Hamadaea sp.]|nr:phosphatase PAP2 family protein [Hamadaea sp.]
MPQLLDRPCPRPRADPLSGGRTARLHPIRELVLITVLFLAYKAGRLLTAGHVGEAYANAGWIWDLERALRLPGEDAVQRLLMGGDLLIRAVNGYYAWVHFPATAAFLLFLYLRRPAHYLWIRRVMTGLTAAALAVHVLYPLAPPRLVPAFGMVDTAARYGPSVYGPPATDTLANQYAAMPSLHIGWAVVVAVGLIAATRTRRRWLWIAHPVVTTLVVVGTANHYWLDGVVACAILVLMVVLVRRPGRADGDDPGEIREDAASTEEETAASRI